MRSLSGIASRSPRLLTPTTALRAMTALRNDGPRPGTGRERRADGIARLVHNVKPPVARARNWFMPVDSSSDAPLA
jgi:hypothetical protein